ncbi:MAG: hypothetical protein ACM3VX_10015 [Bacteroidota bacterium]
MGKRCSIPIWIPVRMHVGVQLCRVNDPEATHQLAQVPDGLRNGPQFISRLFEETCEQLELEHKRIPNAIPNKNAVNAHIEAFNGIMEEECLARNEF